MNTRTAAMSAKPSRKGRGSILMAGAVVVLLAVMAWDTKVMPIEADAEGEGSKLAQFAEETFPEIRDDVEARAVGVGELASALDEDRSAAGERYGVPAGIGPIIPVTVSGVVGEGSSGTYVIETDAAPGDLTIRVQTGPAINGTVLRDATGEIEFGQFKNQIEYQNAGAALNDAMKAQVLAGLDREALEGKNVTVTGVFQLINPANWLITPVAFDVQ
ncbi:MULTISPECIES: DUF2291 family protein [Chromohalobacter]|uniref:Lipoprotein n=1 Tax=Chromohalobacter israelensis (strain ATCC BAA-138 / DSM 3043 / CIP 106854 / NCIMB 13768 / 1H11) TaxID=290398 RepID=Q1R0N6_CHRI1|nr:MULTISPECIES: DUF2291 domain-containing protein [Chromohalobacter]ABE57722.1 conserved hypothetical protein [Chromohalobacter salexigens DSM 3043]MBZ5876199.1 DUF2291 domain-containing protein [Chromohalobacter salexigens]MDO0945157.1 DUF2291 domain-containing protein [Chromohalobacter salexigens]NQY47299.1 DUF2291 domain-containing protein [Chromohalobacter sp.]NWO55658.1 DUF2291 domain-containing protein [Chromohalobacter salexigens]